VSSTHTDQSDIVTLRKVVTFKQLKSLFGIPYSRTHIDRLEEAGIFPPSFGLSHHRNSRRVWWQHEIIAWLEAQAQRAA
jgi:predicted DNA-binding transcriptional regulator AlpA